MSLAYIGLDGSLSELKLPHANSAAAVHQCVGVTVRVHFHVEASPMKIRPLHDRIVVKRLAEETTTKGGIIIPDTAKEKPISGEVLAIGNGKLLDDGKLRPLDIQVGNKILFGKYSGTEVKIDGEERLILKEDDVLGVVES